VNRYPAAGGSALIQINASRRGTTDIGRPDSRKEVPASMTGFTTETIAAAQVRAVFPLLREAVPGLDLTTWLRFARSLLRPRRARCGIVAVRRSARPLPCGLFLYHCETDLLHGLVLVADHFVAMDVLEPQERCGR